MKVCSVLVNLLSNWFLSIHVSFWNLQHTICIPTKWLSKYPWNSSIKMMIRRLHRRRSFGKRCENLGSAFPVILTTLRLVHGSQIAACLCVCLCTYTMMMSMCLLSWLSLSQAHLLSIFLIWWDSSLLIQSSHENRESSRVKNPKSKKKVWSAVNMLCVHLKFLMDTFCIKDKLMIFTLWALKTQEFSQ